jgi:hypothetical protein
MEVPCYPTNKGRGGTQPFAQLPFQSVTRPDDHDYLSSEEWVHVRGDFQIISSFIIIPFSPKLLIPILYRKDGSDSGYSTFYSLK